MPMATKLDRRVIYQKGLPLIKLHDPLITLPCKITWLSLNCPCSNCIPCDGKDTDYMNHIHSC